MTTAPVRPMSQIGGGDLVVGQVWKHEVTYTQARHDWELVDIDRKAGNVTLRRVDERGDTLECKTSIGALLSVYRLVREA